MRIAVCIKQVPLSSEARLDADGRLIRTGKAVTSAFDLRAIALAVDYKQRHGATTAAVTMGPPAARSALAEALGMGIDEAFHIEGRAFAGADTLATARVLAAWLRQGRWDLVLFGKQSLDADTGQVGPQVAELLGFPQVTAARRITLLEDGLEVDSDTDDGFETVRCSLPAVVTCAERLIAPIKLPADVDTDALRGQVRSLGLPDLGAEPSQVGLEGSPTRVLGLRHCPARERAGHVITAESHEAAVAALVDALQSRGALLGRMDAPAGAQRRTRIRRAAGDDVVVCCERRGDGSLLKAGLDLLSHANRIADQISARLTAIVFGRTERGDLTALGRCGADRVILVDRGSDDPRPSAEIAAAAVAGVINAEDPRVVLASGTEWGRAWLPRLAARLGLGLVGDAIGFAIGPDMQMVALKPALGDHLIAEIGSKTRPFLATVRPGVVEPGPQVDGQTVVIERIEAVGAAPSARVIARRENAGLGAVPVEGAERVVGIGAGVREELVPAISHLAQTIDAALGGTRRACDRGLVPRSRQIGLTGKTLRARLYIGLGISGSPNHTVALENVETVVAINEDPASPFFRCADLGLVARIEDVLPGLTAAFGRVMRPTPTCRD